MKLIYFVIASIFLFNPLISNIDILPDFVAYLLIMKALWKDTYTNANAEDAYVCTRNMLIISVAKTLSILLVSSQDTTMSLLLSFSFLLLEMIFGIPFVTKLFKFLSELATNAGNGEEADKTGRMCRFTIGIMATRLIIAVLPDLTALTISNGIDTDAPTNLIPFRPMLILVTSVISLVVCIAWLVIILIHFKKLITKEVIQYSNNSFTAKVSTNKSLFEGRNTSNVFIFFAVCSVFAFNISYGHFVITPDFLLTLALIGGFVFLYAKGYQRPSLPFILLSITAVGQIVVYILETVQINAYYSRYTINEISNSIEATRLYNQIIPFSAVSSVLFVVSISIALVLIYKCGKYSLERNKNLFSGCDFTYQEHEYNKKMMIYSIVAASLGVVCAAVYMLMVVLMPKTTGLVFVNYIVEIAFIFAFLKVIMYVNDEVYKRIYSYS